MDSKSRKNKHRSISYLYNYSLKLQEQIENMITNYKFEDELSNILVMALFKIAIQHHQSILLLLNQGNDNSAGALVRPLIEATYRGQWIIFIANVEIIQKLSIGEENFPSISKIGKSLNEKHKATGFLTSSNNKHLHDLTHGGIEQILRMIDGLEIRTNYSVQDIDYILEESTKHMCLFFVALGIQLDNQEFITLGSQLIIEYNDKIKTELRNVKDESFKMGDLKVQEPTMEGNENIQF